ncbi:30S ribosomal protein S13 [Patescibacteria group bacterium]|nr:30S ribosomal protein S13 [Patescibacteria group bacterium]MBU2035954.1 30S ribosomal protein S13 [Patescibacteria group bacterium]
MARIAGVELQDNWKVDYALTRISGVGWPLSKKIMGSLKISSEKRIKDLAGEEISKITSKLDEISTEGELSRIVRSNISRLQAIGSYRGTRHQKGLPSRGQRTKSNARTKRGKRKTIGAFKKEALARTKTTKSGGDK